MPRARGVHELRAIFARLGRIKPVRRLAIAGAVVGGIYGLHRVRRAYQKNKVVRHHKAVLDRVQRYQDEEKSARDRYVEAYTRMGIKPPKKLTAKEKRLQRVQDKEEIDRYLKQRFPTVKSVLESRYPKRSADPVTPKTSDSVAQEKIAEKIVIEEAAKKYLGDDDVEKEFKVRRVRPRLERTQDVVSRMQGRRRRDYDY